MIWPQGCTLDGALGSDVWGCKLCGESITLAHVTEGTPICQDCNVHAELLEYNYEPTTVEIQID